MLAFEEKLIECMFDNQSKFTSNVNTKIFSGIWSYSNMSVDRVHYDVAVSILKDFDVIFIAETLNETKSELKCFEDGFPEIYWIHNTTKKVSWKLNVFPRLKQVIIRLNKYDIDLYEVAKQSAL